MNCTASDSAGNVGNASFNVTVVGPEENIDYLQDDIQALIDDGVLNSGQANGLTSPLNNALSSLDKGHTNAACSQLQDFIDEVNAKTHTPLDADTAAALIADAEAIRISVGCE